MTLIHLANNSSVHFGGWLRALAVILLCAALPAQTVHLVNDSGVPFGGWIQTTVDQLPPHLKGGTPAANYLLGVQTGVDTWSIDVYTGLAPGERRIVDLSTATPIEYNPQAGIDPAASCWGGVAVSVAGVQLQYLDAKENGAAFDGHWRGRIAPMLVVELWAHWTPDDPAWCSAEVAITCSNPTIPNVTATIPPDMRLRFGDADVLVPGLATNAPLMQDGDTLADAQSRILPVTLCWPRHGGNLEMCRALADQKIQIRGISRLHQSGNPHLPANFDAAKWARDTLPRAIDSLHQWPNSSGLEPAAYSGSTGAQGSQSFVCGPGMSDPLAVGPFYLAALTHKWPMNHLEADGSQLDWKGHPGLRMFFGRVNRGQGMSTDNLGKPVDPTSVETHGYAGPGDEHGFDWCAWGGARFKGTPGTQFVLRSYAIHFLFRWVVVPPGNWLTANRGIGWLSAMAGELFRNLQDRELAEAVRDRWSEVFTQLIWPLGATGAWWSWSTDPRIGASPDNPRATCWQACVCALGIDWAGEAFGNEGARGFAAAIAGEILARTYVKQGDRWTSWNVITMGGGAPDQGMGAYEWFGTPMVLGVILRHDPQHAQAREIWAQMLADHPSYTQLAWMCPGVEVK